MPSFIPISIVRSKPYLLTFTWADGITATIAVEKLREECPCAFCKGETIMGTTYVFAIKQFTPGMNELLSLTPVGNYGVQAVWKDGHDSGIYTWETLREIALTNKLSNEEIAGLEKQEQ